MRFGGWEIVVVLAIILLVFGPGRITKVAGELGKSIKAFKDGLSEDKKDDDGQKPADKEK